MEPPQKKKIAYYYASNDSLLMSAVRSVVILIVAFAVLTVFFYSFWLNATGESFIAALSSMEAKKDKPATLLAQAYRNDTSDAFDQLVSKLASLGCERFFHGNSQYIDGYKRHRVTVQKESEMKLDTSCEAIKSRWRFYGRDGIWNRTGSGGKQLYREREFPLAFARTVFTDYLLLEQMLSVEYEEWNYYCYSLDSKARVLFKRRMHALARCFPNVRIAKREYSVYSNGKNVTRSHLACLEELLRMGSEWKYAILLQNYDIPHKSNWQKTEILREYAGANDIATKKVMPISVAAKQNWTFEALRLYKNGSRNTAISIAKDGFLRTIYLTKSLNLVSLSRLAVEFLFKELALDTFIDKLEASKYGMDEDFYSSINSNLPDFPGGFTNRCLREEGLQLGNMGRYVLWHKDAAFCASKAFRHEVCVFGVEDLAHLRQAKDIPHLYFNKMMPLFDYGASYCWLKLLASKSKTHVNREFYRSLPHVRFQRARLDHGNNTGWERNFTCA